MTKYVRHTILRKCEESISKVKCVRTDIPTHTHTLLSMTKYVRHTILRKCEESISKVKCVRTDIHTHTALND